MKHIEKLVLLVIVALVAAGCGQKSATTGSSGKKSGLTIALVTKSTSHDFWQTVNAGAQAAGKETGATVIFKGPSKETDVADQMTIMEDFITQKVDAIVMAACNSKALIPLVDKAQKAGIPVVTIDSGIDSDIAASFIATDNIKGAEEGADALAILIGEKGDIGVEPIVAGAATSTMRENGFKDGIKKYPKIKIVATRLSNCDESTAMTATENMLTANPAIVGIFSACGPGAVGCARVIEQKGLAGKVKHVAFDAIPGEIDAFKRGSIQVLIVQNPYKMGYEGVKTAVAIKAGKNVPKRMDTGVTVVTRDNFNDPAIQKILFPLKNK